MEAIVQRLIERAQRLAAQESNLCQDMHAELVGRRATVRDESYNGQPYGTSRKSLYGKTLTIAWALPQQDGSIRVGFEESWEGCDLAKVELLERAS